MAVIRNVVNWATGKGINSDYFAAVPYVYNGYLVSVTGTGVTVPVDRAVSKEEAKAWKKELKAYKVASVTAYPAGPKLATNYITAMISNHKPELIDGIINALTTLLAHGGYRPQPFCVFCGQSGTNTYAEDIDHMIMLPSTQNVTDGKQKKECLKALQTETQVVLY